MKNKSYVHLGLVLLAVLTLASSCDNTPKLLTEKELLKTEFNLLLNPYKVAPLSGEAIFTTKEKCRVTVKVTSKEKEKAIEISHSFKEYNVEHKIPVLGLYANVTNQITVILVNKNGDSTVIGRELKTLPLRDDLPSIRIDLCKKDKMQDGLILSDLILATNGEEMYGNAAPFAFDNNGDIRWLYDKNMEFIMGTEKTKSGGLVAFKHDKVVEYAMTGEVTNQITLQGFTTCHDLMELPNGNYLMSGNKIGENYREDYVIEVSKKDGSIVKEYDLKKILDPLRIDFGSPLPGSDWFHLNSVEYDEKNKSIIVSGQRQGIVSFKEEDMKVNWILSPHSGWGKNGTDKVLLTALDTKGNKLREEVQKGKTFAPSMFDWGWGTHSAILLKSGNLMLFDNGVGRHFNKSTFNGPTAKTYSRAVEYDINAEKLEVTQRWQFGGGNSKYYSPFISNVQQLENGNVLFCPGSGPDFIKFERAKVVELIYPSNEIVFEATLKPKHKNGSLKGFGQSDMIYRSFKISLYE